MPDQALGIHCAIGGTGVIGIAEQVVHPVDIKVPVNDPRKRVVSLHDTAQFIGTDAIFFEKSAGPLADNGCDIVMGHMEELLH